MTGAIGPSRATRAAISWSSHSHLEPELLVLLMLLVLCRDLAYITRERLQRAVGGCEHGTACPHPVERGDDAVGRSQEVAGRQVGDDERARSELCRMHPVAVELGDRVIEGKIAERQAPRVSLGAAGDEPAVAPRVGASASSRLPQGMGSTDTVGRAPSVPARAASNRSGVSP